jgi:hypothetical protein
MRKDTFQSHSHILEPHKLDFAFGMDRGHRNTFSYKYAFSFQIAKPKYVISNLFQMTTDQPFFWSLSKINIFNKLAYFAIIIYPSNDNAVLPLFTSFKVPSSLHFLSGPKNSGPLFSDPSFGSLLLFPPYFYLIHVWGCWPIKITLVWFDFYYGKDFNQASCSDRNSELSTCYLLKSYSFLRFRYLFQFNELYFTSYANK